MYIREDLEVVSPANSQRIHKTEKAKATSDAH
jgi:hypothetical protein